MARNQKVVFVNDEDFKFSNWLQYNGSHLEIADKKLKINNCWYVVIVAPLENEQSVYTQLKQQLPKLLKNRVYSRTQFNKKYVKQYYNKENKLIFEHGFYETLMDVCDFEKSEQIKQKSRTIKNIFKED